MKPANRKFLEDNRHHHDTLIRAFYLRHLDAPTREGLMRVMAEEFQPGYTADLWCPVCVSDMVKMVYRVYDDWLARQPPEVPVIDLTIDAKSKMLYDLMDATKKDLYQILAEDSKLLSPPGKPEAAQTVKATFPKHHNPNRRR